MKHLANRNVCAAAIVAIASTIAPASASNNPNHVIFTYSDGATTVVKSGIFQDGNDRRLALKASLEARVAALKEQRQIIGNLARSEPNYDVRRGLWQAYASFRSRIDQLYADIKLTQRVNFADFEELEEFYAPTVSVS